MLPRCLKQWEKTMLRPKSCEQDLKQWEWSLHINHILWIAEVQYCSDRKWEIRYFDLFHDELSLDDDDNDDDFGFSIGKNQCHIDWSLFFLFSMSYVISYRAKIIYTLTMFNHKHIFLSGLRFFEVLNNKNSCTVGITSNTSPTHKVNKSQGIYQM